MTTEQYWVQPYIIAGVGAHKYRSYYGAFLPLGLGLKVNFFDEAYLFINSTYRVPVTTETANYHLQHSIGVAGALSKKKEEKIIPPPPPPPDTDGDGYPDGLEVQNSYSPTSADTTKIKKRIEANLTTQELAYYFGETKLDQFAISGGKTTTPTPVGTFSIIMKRPVVHYKGKNFDYPNTQWNLMFKRGSGVLNYYIHGAWWHHKFGHTVSGGCINVPYEPGYMGRLYDWADLGTEVIVNP
jgi:lipoprotein-anchoring transpeptidase ErfK/SrfK